MNSCLFGGRAAAAAILCALAATGSPADARKSEAQIRKEIIRQSIARYSGSCPCPYNTDRAGRSYGRRSAYSRPGGESPICYPSDVSAAELRARRGD